ncbi:MAG: anti-sigma factor family protein, partial [Steroidobacteraceae bacterium]
LGRLPQWAALAASVVVGVLVGVLLTRSPRPPYEETGGALVARGALDLALSDQLAVTSGEAGVAIGITFKNREGRFCRTFHMQRDAPVSGLACRGAQHWAIEVLAAAPPLQGELRPAAAMPIAVLHAVDAAIVGEPLDAEAEARARDAGWR